MKSLIIISLISLGTFTSTAQEVKQEKSTSVESEQTPPADPNGPYLGRDEKIKGIMKNGEIPASFPKYEKGMMAEDYKMVIFAWIKENKELVKEEEYAKVESKLNK